MYWQIQKQTHFEITQEHLKWFRRKRENFLNRIIAIDETWITDCESEVKSQSNVWKPQTSPQSKKFCLSQSKVKQMTIFVYDKDGIIVTDQVPNSITVTAVYYQKFICSVLHLQIWKLAQKIDSSVSILHNNGRPHVAQKIVNLFINYMRKTLHHPPSSPNLSPPGCDLYPKFKIKKNTSWNVFWKFGWVFADCGSKNSPSQWRMTPEWNPKAFPHYWQMSMEQGGDCIEGL